MSALPVGSPAAASLSDRTAIEAFLVREATLLDDREFEQWRELFDEDGWYWVPLNPAHTDPGGQAALFYDDRKMMQTRIDRLRHPRIHAQTPPHRTCRQVGNVTIVEADAAAGECTVRSTLFLADYRVHMQRTFAAHVRHRLRATPEGYRIAWKRVDLVNADDVHELIAIPF
jgi:3-phenylpropionate/cinnamic acid dioxygenase small subunit